MLVFLAHPSTHIMKANAKTNLNKNFIDFNFLRHDSFSFLPFSQVGFLVVSMKIWK